MTTAPAGSTTGLPLIAFIGESQVGKSSLVNALAGARLLPTTGAGSPRSLAVCEWAIPAVPGADPTWQVTATWLPREALAEVMLGRDAARARLLRQGLQMDQETAFSHAARSLNGSALPIDLSRWAAGRDTSWLPLDIPRPEREARRQMEVLTAGWPAALAASAKVRGSQAAAMCLVDLPGLGHDDVGGQASEAWLAANSSRVAAIICVVGKRTPDLIEEILHRHWAPDDLRDRLHLVATFADHLVEDHTSEADRRRAADARRKHAADHLRGLVGGSVGPTHAFPRTFCLDPRPYSRFWRKVEFDGELERLRHVLAAVRPPPPRPAAKPVAVSVPRPTVLAPPSPSAPRRADVPMAMQRGEDLEAWLSRLVAPALRKGSWVSEPLRSGRIRLHLNAADGRGRVVTLITIYGTGEAYFVGSTPKVRLSPPVSDAAGERLRKELLNAARELGVGVPEPISLHGRSA